MELILIIGAILIASYIAFGKAEQPKVSVVPEPEHQIIYGYYSTYGDQVGKTKDHTNVLWESLFDGLDGGSKNIIEANKPTILDVGFQMFTLAATGDKLILQPTAEENLIKLFDYMHQNGSLQYVKYLVPVDEPNINVTDIAEFNKAIFILKSVARRYIALEKVQYVCVYAGVTGFDKTHTWAITEFDILGVDWYDKGETIFTDGTYNVIKSQLNKYQKTFLFPGGAFEQNPEPFWNFAQINPEVAGIIPFVWFPPIASNQTWVGIGDDKNLMKQFYIDLGMKNNSLSMK